MKWIERKSVTQEPYTVLVAGPEERVLGTYWHRGGAFVPAAGNGQAKPRATEQEAREYVIRKVLERMKAEMAELGKLLFECDVPKLRMATPRKCSTAFSVEQKEQDFQGSRITEKQNA